MAVKEVATIYYRFLQRDRSIGIDYPWSMKDIRESWIRNGNLQPNGGYTVVIVRDEDSGKHYLGISRCSETDRFQRKEGRRQATRYAKLAIENGTKVMYPRLTNKPELAQLSTILDEIPKRFLYDDNSFKKAEGVF